MLVGQTPDSSPQTPRTTGLAPRYARDDRGADASQRRDPSYDVASPRRPTVAHRLYEGGGGCQGVWGVSLEVMAVLPGETGRVKRLLGQGFAVAGVPALDAVGRVWQSLRERGRVVGGEQRSSLYRLFRGVRIRCHGSSLRWRISIENRQAARRKGAPAGAKGWLRVSMCQIASASFLERSIWATFGPRWRPRRFLVRS